MNKDAILQILQARCNEQNLDFKLLQAIISTESGWNPWVCRYEPTQEKYLVTPDIFARKTIMSLDTEKMLQMTSFGLCQTMGYNFRDLGYDGPLSMAFDADINLKYFALFFKKRCDKFPQIEDKIASYNAGSPRKDASGKYVNQDYVNKVLSFYRRLG